jgi:hypothetical protein
VCVRERTMGRPETQKKKKIETEPLWLSFRLDPACKWVWRVLWAHRTLSHKDLMCGELGVSSIWREGVVLLTLGATSLPASPSPPHLIPSSPSAPISLPGTHKWAGYNLMGLVFCGGRVEDDMMVVVFGGVSNSDHFRSRLQF